LRLEISHRGNKESLPPDQVVPVGRKIRVIGSQIITEQWHKNR
jgi:hypothetical protein